MMSADDITKAVYDQARAKAQAAADVQNEQEERERRRRVAEENRRAYDEAQSANRLRRGGGSVFSADGRGNFTSRDFNGQAGYDVAAQWGADYDEAVAQQRVLGQFADLGRRAQAVQRHNEQSQLYGLGAMMKTAKANGGRIPQNALGMFNRYLGFDGKTQGVYGGGFARNGDFVVDVAARGQNGGVETARQTIPLRQQYDMMFRLPGMFGQGDVDAAYQTLRYTHGKDELRDPAEFGAMAQNLRRGAQVRQGQQRQAADTQLAAKVLDAIGKLKSSGKSEQEVLMEVAKSKIASELFSRGGQMYEDADGNPVENPYEEKDGQKVLREGVKPVTGPDDEPVYKRSMDDLIKNVHEAYTRTGSGGDGGDNARTNALLQRYDELMNRMYPPPDPREREMRDMQMDAALDAQRRAGVMQGGQKLLKYRDADGRLVTGNGYYEGGKLYDSRGDEIQGATPLEVNGKEVRALPPANEPAQAGVTAQPQEQAQTNDAVQPENEESAATPDGRSVLASMRKKGPPPSREQAIAALAARRAARRTQNGAFPAQQQEPQLRKEEQEEARREKTINASMDSGGIKRNPGRSAAYARQRNKERAEAAEAASKAAEEARAKAEAQAVASVRRQKAFEEFDRTHKPQLDKRIPEIKSEVAREARSKGWSDEEAQKEVEQRVYSLVEDLAGGYDKARARGIASLLPIGSDDYRRKIKQDYGVVLRKMQRGDSDL